MNEKVKSDQILTSPLTFPLQALFAFISLMAGSG